MRYSARAGPAYGYGAAAHIPGACNIWLDGLPAFGGWVANENTRIFLVAGGVEAMELAVMSLARIDIDTGEGILATGLESWRDRGLPIIRLPCLSMCRRCSRQYWSLISSRS